METTAETEQVVEQPLEARWQPARWELAECTCPDWCERDHELD